MVPAAVVDESIASLAAACWTPATSSSTAAIRTTSTISGERRNSRAKGIHYVDVGTSGGVWGLERGYCMMIGGEDGSCRPSRSDLPDAGARRRRHPADAGTREESTARRNWAICTADPTARAIS